MNFSIEISFDLSGYGKKNLSGEYIIARKGKEIHHNGKQLNKELNSIIRRECEERLEEIVFVTFYSTNNSLIICKKFTNLSKKEKALTTACSQVLISIPKEYDFHKILSSKEVQEVLFKNNYTEYINYFISNNQPFKLFDEIRNFSGDINKFLYTNETSIYEAQKYDNTFICKNQDFQYLFFFLLSQYNLKNKISILSMNLDKNIEKFDKLSSTLSLKELKVREHKKTIPTTDSEKKDIIEMNKNENLKDISFYELEKILKLTTQSIKLDLDIIKTLIYNESSFFAKKKINNDKIRGVIEKSITNLENNKTLNNFIIQELIKRIKK